MLLINNWRRSLADGLLSSATTLELATSPGFTLQGGETATLTLYDPEGIEEALEIVRATAVSGNVLTIQRGQEGTIARVWPTGTAVEQRLTAGQLQQLKADAIEQIPDDAPAAVAPVLGYLRADGQWIAYQEPEQPPGGLTHWADSADTSAAVLTPAESLDAVIAPAAGKALRMDAAGDARGAGAVDLQTTRATADQVAAGPRSAILAGGNNKIGTLATDTLIAASTDCTAAEETEYNAILASFNATAGNSAGDWSNYSALLASGGGTLTGSYLCAVIAGASSEINNANESAIVGSYNRIDDNSSYCFIAGTSNTITGEGWGGYAAAIVGCEGVTVSGSYCSSAIGSSYTDLAGDYAVALAADSGEASANHVVLTGTGPTDRGVHGAFVFGGERKVLQLPLGAIQTTRYSLGLHTTNATPANLVVHFGGAQITITDNGAYAMTGTVVAREGNDAKAWHIQLLAVVGTGTMTLIGTPTVDVIAETAGAASWALALGTTGDTLNVTATGAASRTIRWSGYLDSAESA